MLIGIEQDLRLVVEPMVDDPAAQHMLAMVRGILLDIAARRIEAPVVNALVREAQDQALQDVMTLARSFGAKGTALADRLSEAVPSGDRDGDLLGSAIGALADLAGTEAQAFSTQLRAILARLLLTDQAVAARHQARLTTIASRQPSDMADRGGITRDLLEEFLRAQWPDVPDLAVTRLVRPPMSWGKVTMIADLAGTNLPCASIVVRQDSAVSCANTQVVDEYPILQFVSAQGLPVPGPLFISRETGRFGRPFLVMPELAGSTAGSLAGPSADCTREALFDLARVTAQLHALDPRASDLPSAWRATPARDANRQTVADVHRQLVVDQVASLPLARGTLLWLERNAPPSPDRPIIVHSDLGLWNLLVEGPRVTAVLDWELARIGDPMQDLAYIRPLLGDRMTWAEFVDAYLAAGGQPYRPDAIEFFAMLGDLRNLMFTETMHRIAVTDIAAVRISHVVVTCLRMLERQAAEKLPGIAG